jgi:hypothetical protein
MRKTHPIFLSTLLLLSSCTTLEQSIRLGSATGALTGAAATYAASQASHRSPSMEDVGIGAGVGLGLGLIASYLIHQQVVGDREEQARRTEIYFGDLPPSPFLIPQQNSQKGSR